MYCYLFSKVVLIKFYVKDMYDMSYIPKRVRHVLKFKLYIDE